MRAVVLAVAVCVSACGGGKPEASPKGLGQQAADVAADTETMREAQGAANEVIRATGDCDAVKGLLPGTNAALDAAEKKIRTATGRVTLDALRKQVRNIVEICP